MAGEATVSLVHIVLDVSGSMANPVPKSLLGGELERTARWICEEAGLGGVRKICAAAAGIALLAGELAGMRPDQLMGSRYLSISTMGQEGPPRVYGPVSLMELRIHALRALEAPGTPGEALASAVREAMGLDLVELARIPQHSMAPTDACHILEGLERVLASGVFEEAGRRHLLLLCYSDCCINAYSCWRGQGQPSVEEALEDLRGRLDRLAEAHGFSPPLVVALLAGDPKLVGLEAGACPLRAMTAASDLEEFRESGFPGSRELLRILTDDELFYIDPGMRQWPYIGEERLGGKAVRYPRDPGALARALARITTAGTGSRGRW